MNDLKWTETQVQLVADLVAEEVEKARLSHKFIPEMKLTEDARSVAADAFDPAKNAVDDVTTLPLVELSVPVNLTKLQAEDADLSAALLLIRRAANALARAHDTVVLDETKNVRLPVVAVPPNGQGISVQVAARVRGAHPPEPVATPGGGSSRGEELVRAVSRALLTLEGGGYVGSYVLVLGQLLFEDAHTPSAGSLVLPSDRIGPLIGDGPIHRSSVLPQEAGLLLSLGGEPVDRAVAVAPRFEFLRVGTNEVRECRVYERFTLKFKETGCAVLLLRQP